MVPSGICFCQRRMGAPRPKSKTRRSPAASIRVLLPNRSAAGMGLPVPSRVTVMVPSPASMPLTSGSPPQAPVVVATAPFPPELPAAPAAPAAPPDPPEAARPLVLLLQPPTTRAAVTTIAQDFHATRCLIVTLPSE